MDFKASKQDFHNSKTPQQVPELTPERKEVIRMMLTRRLTD